ncbi:S66 family peptidase [Isobaculum melis]|uniref:Muramoyltetrapeptide carboxypeptidase LdcA (Peptidoglycan recycling) n=1 Tax=Isobaculum melis TaxID=142588 RepID=A0A1H9UCZ5_9LACT|nr:S66 peptidase family protein [Isobaculum melis]SES07219.1 Muramoyltetrapeptide carboxypeptidase LdcA (peptidoglycan recycling) [Isobaculum melis]
MLKKGDRIALVVNSNGLAREKEKELHALQSLLLDMGLIAVFSRYLYQKETIFSGTAEQRGSELMSFYQDSSIAAIFDISGGDVANQVLPSLDYEWIKAHPKPFFGYSDLTTILNALYEKAGSIGYLYQIRTLLWDETGKQKRRFEESLLGNQGSLFECKWQFIQGHELSGVVIGGNIRCLLKLAGTPYFPNFQGKLLFLESSGGGMPQQTAYLNQLAQMGIFEQVSGILLGTFTELDQTDGRFKMSQLVAEMSPNADFPIAVTSEIGHDAQAKCLIIGETLHLKR